MCRPHAQHQCSQCCVLSHVTLAAQRVPVHNCPGRPQQGTQWRCAWHTMSFIFKLTANTCACVFCEECVGNSKSCREGIFFFFFPIYLSPAAAVIVWFHPPCSQNSAFLGWYGGCYCKVEVPMMLMVESQEKAATEALRWQHCLNVDVLWTCA